MTKVHLPVGRRNSVQGVGTGRVIAGRYGLQERRAHQGDLEVWSGTDTLAHRPVSITVFPVSIARADAALDAARRAAVVDDPRLVAVLDVGSDHGTAWIVEESLSSSSTLATLLQDGPLGAEESRRIAGEVASALDVASRRGLHHLHLSPYAIRRTHDGRIKLAGLATAAAIEGTEESSPDHAALTDTKGALAVLYAALTARWPLDGPMPGLDPAPRIVGGVAAPSEITVGVPADLDLLCRTVLNGQPGPSTPGELAAQIAPWPDQVVDATAPHGPDNDDATTAPLLPLEPAIASPPMSPTPPTLPIPSADAVPDGAPDPSGGGAAASPTGAAPAVATDPATQAALPAATDPAAQPPAATASPLAPTAPPATGPSAVPPGGGTTAASAKSAPAKREHPVTTAESGNRSAEAARPPSNAPARDAQSQVAAAAAQGPDIRPETAAGQGSPAVFDRLSNLLRTAASALVGARGRRDLPAGSRGDAESGPGQLLGLEQALHEGPSAPLPPPTPLGAHTTQQRDGEHARLVLGIVAGLIVIAMLIAVPTLFSSVTTTAAAPPPSPSQAQTSATPPSGTATTAPTALRIQSATGFDPLGDGTENGAQARQSYDGDPSTAWTSEGYRGSAEFGGTKEGVGVIYTLAPGSQVTTAQLTLASKPQDLTVYVSTDRSLDGAQELGKITNGTGQQTVQTSAPLTGRYVIVWFTKAAHEEGDRYRCTLAEVAFLT